MRKRLDMRTVIPFLVSIGILLLGNACGAQEWRANLPSGWLGVVIVHDLPEFDRQADRMAKMFGMEAPQLVRLLEAAGLTDLCEVERSWIVGLAQGSEVNERTYPFAFIPVIDFESFSSAYDGDLNGKSAIVTIEQQDLLAGKCGKWVLLMNPDRKKEFDNIMARKPESRAESGEELDTNGIATVNLSQLGLKWLAEYQPAREQLPREHAIARRKRGFAMLSLEGLRESLTLDKPVWRWVAATYSEATLSVEFDDKGAAKLLVVAAKKIVSDEVIRAENGAEVDLLGEPRFISAGSVQTSPELAKLAAGWQVAQLASTPEELGIDKYADAEFVELKKALAKVIGQVTTADFAALAGDDLPIYGNRVATVSVSSSEDFIEACDELMNRWNALITASKAEVKLRFSAEPVEIAGRVGRRYFVDMVEAVDVPRSREVAKVMAEMFGPNGILNWYVLPLGNNRILVANLPRGEVEKLLKESKREAVKPQSATGTATLAFDASAYVDWSKRRDRAMQGEVIGGPRFVPLPKAEPLHAQLSERGGNLKIELELPPSLLQTLGEYSQELRQQ